MVRAAFEGDGASFPSTAASFRVSAAWRKARRTAKMEVAINRPPTRLRFPQGSEVWITGCPKFADSRKIRTDQPGTGSGDGAARASAMARGFRLSSELIAGVVVGAVIGWGFDRLLSTSPFGLIVFVPARLRGRRGQRGEIGRRGSGQNQPLRRKAGRIDCRAPAWPAVPKRCRADDRSDRTVPHRKALHDWPYRQSGDRLHQFIRLHVRFGGADFAADDRRRRRTAAGAGTHPVGRRDQLRIRRQHRSIATPARKE